MLTVMILLTAVVSGCESLKRTVYVSDRCITDAPMFYDNSDSTETIRQIVNHNEDLERICE